MISNRKKMKFKILLILIAFIIIYAILYRNTQLNYFRQRYDYNINNQLANNDKIEIRFFCQLQPILSNTSELKALIISKSSSLSLQTIKELTILFELNRIQYKIQTVNSNQINTIRLNSNRTIFYNLIIFESEDLFYDSLDLNNKLKLIDFSKLFNIGLILFFNNKKVNEYNFKYLNLITNDETIKLNILKPSKSIEYKCNIKCASDLFKITKCENIADLSEIQNKTKQLEISFDNNFNRNIYESLFKCNHDLNLIIKTKSQSKLRLVLISTDLIEFAQTFSSILHDLVSYASFDRFKIDLIRYVQIDIDDIFVGSSGKRMKTEDVQQLIEFQENYLNKIVFDKENFKFTLGYSGYYYQSGNELENRADYLLIENREYFNWFDHGWSHYQPHILNSTTLLEQMYYNHDFALRYDLPTDLFYAVSPHHSGIYPVYDQFFKHWSDVWLIKVTSTEEYPHLRPYWMRRGFIHNQIMVLPRQTCGIYTHTILINSYPNGIESLYSQIYGGEIFKNLLNNKISVYMTHMTNYGSDRIALFLFRKLFDFLLKWTNLKFESLRPLDLANKYFELYPNDREPIWTNMCQDKRHVSVWSLNDTSFCERFPKLIVLGPQKTGTTALYTFLNEHPFIKSNKFSKKDNFEETQFFSNKNYFKGVDWYLKLFKRPINSSMILFEKSATYFTETKAPIRIKSLLKLPKFVIITIDPVDRAYSWYQHMKAHNDSIAVNFSFYEIISLNVTVNKTVYENMKKLRERCLDPGLYYKHFLNWLKHFSYKQFFLVDGDKLKHDPYETMIKLQQFVSVEKIINYRNIIRYNKKKKFMCVNEYKLNRIKCLGSSKGRQYEKMDSKSRYYLEEFYKFPNRQFSRLLKKYNYQTPIWLQSKYKRL